MADIPVTFAIDYSRMVQQAVQQADGSRLMGTVAQVKRNVQGKSCYFHTIGSKDMAVVSARHGATVYANENYDTRRASMYTYALAAMIDEEDDIRTLLDPRNAETQSIVASFGRRIDDTIIAALGGNADVMDASDDATATALPTAQKVAAGSAGFTLAKLLSAKEILDAAEAPDYQRYFVYSSEELAAALAVSQFTSQDYAVVKALAIGDIDTFAGFKFIRSERLLDDGTNRLCYAYQSGALGLGIGMDPRMRASVLPDRNYSTGVHGKLSHGAVRVEDKRVVQVACLMS